MKSAVYNFFSIVECRSGSRRNPIGLTGLWITAKNGVSYHLFVSRNNSTIISTIARVNSGEVVLCGGLARIEALDCPLVGRLGDGESRSRIGSKISNTNVKERLLLVG